MTGMKIKMHSKTTTQDTTGLESSSSPAPAPATTLADSSESDGSSSSESEDAESPYERDESLEDEDGADEEQSTTSDKEHVSTSRTASAIYSSEELLKIKDRTLQYALFPLPPTYPTSIPTIPNSSSRQASHVSSRSSTPVSPAFSPYQPPRMPLPALPSTPSPVLTLPRSREGSGYFPFRQHPQITLPTVEESSQASRSHYQCARFPKSSSDTVSPLLPYLQHEEVEESQTRSRISTVRPFEEKLSLPPSPLHMHEFAFVESQAAPSSPRVPNMALALEPSLPIESPPSRGALPAHQDCPSSPPPPVLPKSPSVHSLQQFDEMLSVGLEATAREATPSTTTSRRKSTCSSMAPDAADYGLDAAVGRSIDQRTGLSRSFSENSLAMYDRATVLPSAPTTVRRQRQIVFDECSSSDEEAFDLSLDADAIEARYRSPLSRDSTSAQANDNNQSETSHSPESSSASSSSFLWATPGRRASSATDASQVSSASGAEAPVRDGGASEAVEDLAATLKQGLGIYTEDTCDRREPVKKGWLEKTEYPTHDLPPFNALVQVPMEPYASQATLPRHDEQNTEESPPAVPKKTLLMSSPRMPASSNSEHGSLRSRLPKLGLASPRRRQPSDTPSYTSSLRRPSDTPSYMSSLRRPSDTPSYLSSLRRPSEAPSYTSSCTTASSSQSQDEGRSYFNSSTNNTSPPESLRSKASLASFSIDKLRNAKSSPLLRRKASSQLPLAELGGVVLVQPNSKGGSDSKPAGDSSPPPSNLGPKDTSLPNIPTSHSDVRVRKGGSFLPTYHRRRS